MLAPAPGSYAAHLRQQQRRRWAGTWAGVAVAAGAVVAMACGAAPSSTPPAGPDPGGAVAPQTQSSSPSNSNGKEDKGWTLQSVTLKDSGFGTFKGAARVTNGHADAQTASFTITVFDGSSVVATLKGTVVNVSAGKTVTVDLFSTDDYRAGKFTTAFQCDLTA